MRFFLSLVVLTLTSVAAMSQTIIQGTVKDVKGDPLIGVNVMLKGYSTGVSTDVDGRYSISLGDRE